LAKELLARTERELDTGFTLFPGTGTLGWLVPFQNQLMAATLRKVLKRLPYPLEVQDRRQHRGRPGPDRRQRCEQVMSAADQFHSLAV
jgi:hypothetical protein